MKILKIESGELCITPIEDRLFKVVAPIDIAIHTDEGVLRYHIREGFVTNFRSGSKCIDWIIPEIGDTDSALAFLIHDCNFTQCFWSAMAHPVSKSLADYILKEMLLLAGWSNLKASMVYKSVDWFGQDAYDEAPQYGNEILFKFTWDTN